MGETGDEVPKKIVDIGCVYFRANREPNRLARNSFMSVLMEMSVDFRNGSIANENKLRSMNEKEGKNSVLFFANLRTDLIPILDTIISLLDPRISRKKFRAIHRPFASFRIQDDEKVG